MSNIIDVIEQENLRTDLPNIKIGQTVKVWFKIKEGNKERLQAFEGVVIARKNGSIRETFTDIHCSSSFIRCRCGKNIPIPFSKD